MTKRNIAVIGLGYVGLPLAVALSKQFNVVGFDISELRVSELNNGLDRTGGLTKQDLESVSLKITSSADDIIKADFYIVTVPTPVNSIKQPDLSFLVAASELVGKVLQTGDIVVYESTVYPGVTEDVCLPVLEAASGLRGCKDFYIGYSPERINPGDKEHSFSQVKKIVSARDPKILQIISAVYSSVIEAGVFETSSIRVAEAAKVIENSQRDINIAFVNELKIIFDKLDIDIHQVLEAANTKWNFLPFVPGLVGGHCIGVDPYYLAFKAQEIGYNPEVILAGRRINDHMGNYVAARTIKQIIRAGIVIQGLTLGVLGFSFKEDCPDVRNTKVIDVVNELKSYGITIFVYDPIADAEMAAKEYGINFCGIDDLKQCDVLLTVVPHKEFSEPTMQAIVAHARLHINFKA